MSQAAINRIIFVLALLGVGISVMLTIAHYEAINIPCGASGGCEEVANHYTAKGFGIPWLSFIPTAAFGVMAYIAVAALSFGRVISSSPRVARAIGVLILALTGSGVAISGYLTYLEAYVIHAWCRWCVASAIVMTLLFIAALAERCRCVSTYTKETVSEIR